MKLAIFLIALYFPYSAKSIEFDSYKDQLRPYVERFLGKSASNTLLGEKKSEQLFKLPEIPEIKQSATDTSVYNKNSKVHSQGESFFALSQEQQRKFDLSFLEELYLVTRLDQASEEELSQDINIINQGGSREGVYRRIVLDERYAKLESFQEIPSDSLIEFTKKYAARFLRVSYEDENMKKVNLFTIKRLVVERTLETLEVLANREDDLHRWYAIFSSYVAESGDGVFQGKVRKNTNQQFHYNWSKQVPFQHIKSEVIIKLHKLMNSFQKSVVK